MKVAVIKYESGNIQSVFNAIKYLNYSVDLVSDPSNLDGYDVIILPGVGAFEPAMKSLKLSGFEDKLQEIFVKGEKLILGICLGMQLMCRVSQEGGVTTGLGWVDAEVVPLRNYSKNEKVPHIGWNEIDIKLDSYAEFNGKDVYFVHSYCVKPNISEQVIATTTYCTVFASIVRNKNAIGMQFHPEKSQKIGLNLLNTIISSFFKESGINNIGSVHA